MSIHPLNRPRRPGEREAHTIDRRTFLAGTGAVLLAAPRAADAQQAAKMYRIGLLATRPTHIILDPFVADMQTYGWVQGRHYILGSRFTEGYYQRAPALAAELASRPVDILLTFSTANARAARDATAVIPIVMATSGYPVEAGLVKSLAQPGGNVTGNSVFAGGEVFAKYLSLIRDVKPRCGKWVFSGTMGRQLSIHTRGKSHWKSPETRRVRWASR